jgi:hypothetical protein
VVSAAKSAFTTASSVASIVAVKIGSKALGSCQNAPSRSASARIRDPGAARGTV